MEIPRNRVDQLDSKLLDNELFEMLYGNLISCFQQQNLPRFIANLKTKNSDELRLIIKLVIFKFTLWNTDSTYGMGLQNLKVSGKRHDLKKKLLLGLVVGNYLLKKFESYIYSTEDESKLTEFFKGSIIKLQNLLKTLSLVNFLIFLLNGKYPTLIFRFLQLQLNKLSPNSVSMNDTENISYEFQNRQLVWNTLTEFLIFMIPMLKISNFHRFWKNNKQNTENVLIDKKPLNQCAICIQDQRNNNLTIPYVTNCNHIYCYICIVTKLEKFNESNQNQSVKEYWKCLECGNDVRWCRPYDDIDESAIAFKNEEDEEDEEEEQEREEEEEEEDDDDDESDGGDTTGSDELEEEMESDFFVQDGD